MDQPLPLTTFDIIFIGVVGLSALLAFFRGVIRETFSLAAWVGAFVVAAMTLDVTTAWVERFIDAPRTAKAVAAVGVYIVSFIGISIVNAIITRSLLGSLHHGALDRSLGFAFGMVRGVFIFALTHLIASQVGCGR